MLHNKFDKPIIKLTSIIALLTIGLMAYKMQTKAMDMGMDGNIKAIFFALFSAIITAFVFISTGKKPK